MASFNGAEIDNGKDVTAEWILTTFGEGTSSGVVLFGSNLNPFAEEWDPFRNRAPEEDRCCFLTFSNGYPLTERQIVNFFNLKYGSSCVERVYIHRPHPRDEQPPLFGKVVFHSSLIPAIMLGGEPQVKFLIGGKALWCKKFNKDRLRRQSIY